MQMVVACEIANKFPRQGLELTQTLVDHDARNALESRGKNIRGVAQVMVAGAPWTEWAHDTGKALGPITGPKASIILRYTMDNELLNNLGH